MIPKRSWVGSSVQDEIARWKSGSITVNHALPRNAQYSLGALLLKIRARMPIVREVALVSRLIRETVEPVLDRGLNLIQQTNLM